MIWLLKYCTWFTIPAFFINMLKNIIILYYIDYVIIFALLQVFSQVDSILVLLFFIENN